MEIEIIPANWKGRQWYIFANAVKYSQRCKDTKVREVAIAELFYTPLPILSISSRQWSFELPPGTSPDDTLLVLQSFLED